jgi:hypothetical protein
MGRSGPLDGAGVALVGTGTVVLGTLALTENFAELPAAVAAYAVAWWVLGLDRSTSRSGDTR